MKIRTPPDEYKTSYGSIYTTCPDCGMDQTVQPGKGQCSQCGAVYWIVVEWPEVEEEE